MKGQALGVRYLHFRNAALPQKRSIYVRNDNSYLSMINQDLEKGVHKENAIW